MKVRTLLMLFSPWSKYVSLLQYLYVVVRTTTSMALSLCNVISRTLAWQHYTDTDEPIKVEICDDEVNLPGCSQSLPDT